MNAQRRHREAGALLPQFDPLPLGCGEEQEAVGRSIGCLHRRSQQRDQVGAQPLDAIGVEQILGQKNLTIQSAARSPTQHELQIKPAGFGATGEWLRFQTVQHLQGRLRQLDQLQCHLHERIAAGVPWKVESLHHQLEGQLLVVVGPGRAVPHLSQQLPEALASLKPWAYGKGVDEEADQGFEIGMVAAPDRHSDGEVVLAAGAMEQQGDQGQEPHLQGGALNAAELLEWLQQRRLDPEAHAFAPVGGHRRPRPIGGQLQRLEIHELGKPVLLQLSEPIAAQALALPGRVVLIKHREGLEIS